VFVLLDGIPAPAWVASLAVGLPAVAILVVNNLRDIDTDRVAGKHTLAVRLGAARTRTLFAGAIVAALLATIALGLAHPWALLGLVAAPFALGPIRIVRTHAAAPSLVRALVATARFQLVLGALLAIGLEVSR
jgi:1,4-dihydroxy-2-naphthoate octaprenyltransferase